MSQYLSEAFKRLEFLNEDTFSIDNDGLDDFIKFEENDEFEDSIDVIDPEAETLEDVQDSYVGKVILDCCVCHSKIYKDVEDVVIEDDLANVNEECPFCYTTDGFKVVGQVAPFGENDDETDDESDDIDEGLLNEAFLTEGKFLDTLKKVATRVGADASTIVRCFAELGDMATGGNEGALYELAEYVENKAVLKALMSGNEKVFNTCTKEDIEDLKDGIERYKADKAKKKADPKAYKQGKKIDKYQNKVDKETDLGAKELSNRTRKKIDKAGLKLDKDAFGEYQVKAKDTNEALKEDINNITLDTDDSHMEVNQDENGKVTISTEPITSAEIGDETIQPLEPEVQNEIDSNVADGEEIEIDMDEFDEESFDELGEGYLKEVYENVDSFKTSKVSFIKDKLMLEGVIKFNSGKAKKTNFIFGIREATKSGKVRFIGENKEIARGRKSFTITGRIQDKKFLSESFNYNYGVKTPSGKAQRLYGTIKNKKRG